MLKLLNKLYHKISEPVPDAETTAKAFENKRKDIVGKLVVKQIAGSYFAHNDIIVKFGQCVGICNNHCGEVLAKCLDSNSKPFYAKVYDCFWCEGQQAYVERI
jgi:energy-converting hydrogenase A subunit M